MYTVVPVRSSQVTKETLAGRKHHWADWILQLRRPLVYEPALSHNVAHKNQTKLLRRWVLQGHVPPFSFTQICNNVCYAECSSSSVCFNRLKWMRFLAGVAWWGHWCLCRKWVETSCFFHYLLLLFIYFDHQTMISPSPPPPKKMAQAGSLYKFTDTQHQGSKEEVSTKNKAKLGNKDFFSPALPKLTSFLASLTT